MKSVWYENLTTGAMVDEQNSSELYHPASLLKLFVARAVDRILEQDLPAAYHLSNTQRAHIEKFKPELKTALSASLKDSDNNALSYLVDFISDTESGLELPDIQDFVIKRGYLHYFFPTEKGYSEELKLPNKCFEFDYYGRDKQLVDLQANQCTVKDVALVMKEIYQSKRLLKAIKRSAADTADYQATNFIAAARNITGSFFSKAGWNSRVRHDALIHKQGDCDFLIVEMRLLSA